MKIRQAGSGELLKWIKLAYDTAQQDGKKIFQTIDDHRFESAEATTIFFTKPVQDAPPLAVGRNERSWGRLDAYPKMEGD